MRILTSYELNVESLMYFADFLIDEQSALERLSLAWMLKAGSRLSGMS